MQFFEMTMQLVAVPLMFKGYGEDRGGIGGHLFNGTLAFRDVSK